MLNKNLILVTLTVILLGCANRSTVSQVESIPTSTTANAKSLQTKSTVVTDTPKAINQLRTGNFVNGEHPTSGKANLVYENGTYFVELDQTFQTSDKGPDLFVILHRSPDVLKTTKPPYFAIAEGDYIVVAPLKSFNGKQRYAVPKDIQPDQYQSIAIWCRQFNATFGAASLTSS
ncbi:DM13 domain-containing protein [Pseudanabaena yagii]|uniref:DM13 domain-containing protein n=1 Tax=Pseudanabaena yagii GIHE-NHR1 TaxID=2722753 RepID=A0ABX1LPS6_9CYAN|nr:DM13 domain-containing protein [Pseudanabaena yagii]NMF58130.1 DM13 domain-containing protein [Pseudanabaena yagii GIHE-NHR1]